jgi:hypothetical protein
VTAVTASEARACNAACAVAMEASSCSCRSGQALASTSTIIRACPRHTYVRDVPAPQVKRTKDSTDDREQPQCDRNQARPPDR